MKYARAIIQPSRFEGWSTVIEDAMAMNQPVIVSDLEVNKEQLGEKGVYFDIEDSQHLAQLIDADIKVLRVTDYNYSEKLLKFAKIFIDLLK
jgi:glycosyltransferase involved in cell wall biosynthesis